MSMTFSFICYPANWDLSIWCQSLYINGFIEDYNNYIIWINILFIKISDIKKIMKEVSESIYRVFNCPLLCSHLEILPRVRIKLLSNWNKCKRAFGGGYRIEEVYPPYRTLLLVVSILQNFRSVESNKQLI